MPAITGSVITTIMLNDFDNTITTGDGFSGIVPTQRVKVCFDHNKTEYLTGIFGVDATGNFDINLVSFTAYLLDSPPPPPPTPPATGNIPITALVLTTEIDSDTSTNRVDCTTFRIEEEWANLGLIKYCVGEWKFSYTLGGLPVTDYVRKTVDLNFRVFDETNISLVGIVDDTATTVADTVCDTYTGFLYPVFTSNLTGEHTQGLVTYAKNGIIQEENNHVNTNISQSDTPIVSGLSPVNPIILNDNFQFGVDLSKVTEVENCFNTILIYEGVLGVTTCDCINIELAQTLVSSNSSQYNFDMAFTLSGGILAGEVDNIEFSYNGTIVGTYQFNGTLTGTINVILPIGLLSGNSGLSEYTYIINRSNGCNYSNTTSMLPTTNTVDDATCPLYCTLCFTSVDPTGSVVYFQTFGGATQLGDPAGYDVTKTYNLIVDIETWLTSEGYTYNQVLVSTNIAGGPINDVCITGTDLPIGVIEILYEDFGIETGVETACLEVETSTTCSVQWNGVSTEGNAFLEYSDGTNVGDVGGYTGAQVLDLANDMKTDAILNGFVCGSVAGGINGGGFIDFVTLSNTSIPENYYRIRWATAGANVYGIASGCVTV